MTQLLERRTASGPAWEAFSARVERLLSEHRVVADNAYCNWFEKGEANLDQTRDLVVQFSVFSNLFIVAQLLKTINAPTLSQSRDSCEILVNELGVVFNGRAAASDGEVDADLVATEGSVDGGTYRFGARHFEWLLRVGEPLGLGFEDLGKRRHGTPSTLFFCDALSRLYGAEDVDLAEGASYAVEHWAAAGFWKQLITGLEAVKAQHCPKLRLAFFTWHDRVEDQHAAHTHDELLSAYCREDFNEERFLAGMAEMLDAVAVFWDGLFRDAMQMGAK